MKLATGRGDDWDHLPMALEATAGQGWQQRLQTPAERWEEFLPRETLLVLQTLNLQHKTTSDSVNRNGLYKYVK